MMPQVQFLVASLLLLSAPAAFAQASREARVVVTVVDATGAILPGATVTVVSADAPATPATATTGDNGVATIPGLRPGVYSIDRPLPGGSSLSPTTRRCADRSLPGNANTV